MSSFKIRKNCDRIENIVRLLRLQKAHDKNFCDQIQQLNEDTRKENEKLVTLTIAQYRKLLEKGKI